MPSAVQVVCPNCSNKLKIPEEYVGKKIRCKKCATVFAAKPSASKPEKAAAKPTADTIPVSKQDPDEIDGDKAYGTASTDLAPRCPTCAAELESENQVICLNCGYNLRTRVKTETKAVYETQSSDVFMWLLPGIICVVVIVLLVVIDIICWVNMSSWLEDSFLQKEDGTWYLKPGAFTFYLCLFSAFIIVPCVRFAIKRLIINNKPPEEIKKK